MENTGWIKVHRKLVDNPYMRKPAYLAVWMQLLLRAQHDGKQTVLFKGERITLQPGQLTCGRNQLSRWTGVPANSVQRILEVFENEHQIEQRTSNECRLIQILNWTTYQENEQPNEQQMNNKRTTDEQRMNTKQECKNERNTEITNVIEKNSQGGDTEKKEYGDARINYALRVMREKFNRDDFKESKKMQRIYAKQLLTLGKKIGKDEFHKRCTAIAEDPFKFKNCGSLKYIYGELKSYTEILTEEQRKEQARQREIEESDRRSQETWDRIMAKRALYQSQENT